MRSCRSRIPPLSTGSVQIHSNLESVKRMKLGPRHESLKSGKKMYSVLGCHLRCRLHGKGTTSTFSYSKTLHERGQFTHRKQSVLLFEGGVDVADVYPKKLVPRRFARPQVDKVVQNRQLRSFHLFHQISNDRLQGHGVSLCVQHREHNMHDQGEQAFPHISFSG